MGPEQTVREAKSKVEEVAAEVRRDEQEQAWWDWWVSPEAQGGKCIKDFVHETIAGILNYEW